MIRHATFTYEMAVFLLASALTVCAAYGVIASKPARLHPSSPLAFGDALPSALPELSTVVRWPEDMYVVDGKESKLIDPRTHQRVNREWLSPFEPYVTARLADEPKPPRPSPVLPSPVSPGVQPHSASANPDPPALHLCYMGVMSAEDSEPCGLLKPRDGSPAMRVKTGSKVKAGGELYTVASIERQAIWVTDSGERRYMLKDMMFEQRESPEANQPSHTRRTKQD